VCRYRLAIAFLLLPVWLSAQTGIIKGRVFDEINNESIPFANVIIQGTTIGSPTDIDGYYVIEGLDPGVYNLQVSFIGYETAFAPEVVVANNVPTTVDFPMSASDLELDEVVVSASPFQRNDASPVSLNTIGVNEIQRSPGGNRDISKVIQTLPGVAAGVSFRNDLIVRGGSPNENRFFLDGIEVPTINHFATQGATGGPIGLINVDFVKNVDFYSGAFPANRGNTLSSLLEFQLKEGRTDRVGLTGTVGANDFGLTLEGPMGARSNFLVSGRVSYLQWLFKALELPFLPLYVDGQYKSIHKFNEHHDLTFIGLGAFDRFTLNLGDNKTEEQQYFLGVLPYQDQWNYTVGARYRYFRDRGYFTFVVSRNHLDNYIYKFQDNDNENPARQLFDYRSAEIENKVRAEHTVRLKGFKINYGIGYERAGYSNETTQMVASGDSTIQFNYQTDIGINKYALFAQVSRKLADEKVGLALGFRADGNDYDNAMANPFRQFSPRFSISYAIRPGLTINANTGLYFQLPPYTSLGYKDAEGNLVNKENNLKYIRNVQAVGGIAYTTAFNAKISVEGFFKYYDQYPMVLEDGISLANLGGDFGVVGDEAVASLSEGKTYGMEFLFQQKLYKGFYGILTYTWYRSKFTNDDGMLSPSAWDLQHIITVVGGKKFKRNWEVGVKWRFYGGAPYTPFDVEYSVLTNVWDVNNEGQFDYTQINTMRLKAVHQLDIRVDKKWYFDRWNLDMYLDITNVYNNKAAGQDELTVERDESGIPEEDPDNPGSYIPKFIPNDNGQLIPTVGVVITF
jgi:hypothetical protein